MPIVVTLHYGLHAIKEAHHAVQFPKQRQTAGSNGLKGGVHGE